MTMAAKLTRFRKQTGMAQEDMARLLNISRKHLSAAEWGRGELSGWTLYKAYVGCSQMAELLRELLEDKGYDIPASRGDTDE